MKAYPPLSHFILVTTAFSLSAGILIGYEMAKLLG